MLSTRCHGIIGKWKSTKDRCGTSKKECFFLIRYLSWLHKTNIKCPFLDLLKSLKASQACCGVCLFVLFYFYFYPIWGPISDKLHLSSIDLANRKSYHAWGTQSFLHIKAFHHYVYTTRVPGFLLEAKGRFASNKEWFYLSASDCTAPYDCRHLDNQAKATFQSMS